MKKITLCLAIGILSLGLLAGCGSNEAPVPPQTPATPETPSVTGDAAESAASLQKMIDLQGCEDEQVVAAFGEGTANYLEGSEQLLSREFPLSLFGEAVMATVAYGDDGANLVSGTSIRLGGKELAPYKAALETAFGASSQTDAGSNQQEGNGKQSVVWNTEKASITLLLAYEEVSIEIVPTVK